MSKMERCSQQACFVTRAEIVSQHRQEEGTIMKRSSISTFGILVAAVLLVASSLPAAAQVQYKVVSVQAPTATQDLEEAEMARAVALDSWGVQHMQQLAASEGLRLKTDRHPLTLQLEENGQRLYTADRQAVAFLGEQEGQRIYEVALGFESAARSHGHFMIPSVMEELPVREASLVLAVVDVISQEVQKVIRIDISDQNRDGVQSVVMQHPDGQRSRYLVSSDGMGREMTKDGMTRLESTSLKLQRCNSTQSTSDTKTCSIICGVSVVFSCAIITAATGGILSIICGLIGVWICSEICV